MKRKIVYDKESEVLSVEMGKSKSADSDIRGNVVIDYAKDGSIVRVNFYSFSFDDFQKSSQTLKKFSSGQLQVR